MKKNLFLIAAIPILMAGCNTKMPDLTWVTSHPGAVWQMATVEDHGEGPVPESLIRIYTEQQLQVIDGFGACFNELGWEALSLLPPDKRTEVMESLFDLEKGCRFNIFRMPIGANDYAVDWYSHNEETDDFGMNKFSIERDRERLIPYIREATSINPDFILWASPWAPPSWMKTNSHYACSPDVVNDLTADGAGEEMVTQFRMQEAYLNAYALYFSRFIREYSDEGIDIYAVHVQNEPNSCQNFPSCIWRPEDLGTFIGSYLGPHFEREGLDTEIWLGTIERPQIERVDSALKGDAMQYVKGVGFQWAGKGAIADVHQKYPEMKLMQTESECGDGSNDWAAADHTFGLMKHYLSHGANAYLYWNMVLNETGKSQWGWKQNSLITIDSQSLQVTFNPEYYLMKHFSRFIEPGAIHLATSEENTLAFRNEGSLVIIHYQPGESATTEFALGGKSFRATLPAGSFNTFVIPL